MDLDLGTYGNGISCVRSAVHHAAFGAAPPNGTETLLLVLLLWVATWMVAVGELERVQQLDKTRS